jgi:transposase
MHTRRAGARPRLRPGLDGRHDLLQDRRKIPAVLQRPRIHQQEEPAQGLRLARFRDLTIRARLQLSGRIVLIWDNVRLHLTRHLREFIAANADWLTVVQLPTYTPDLNPTEGIRSLAKRDIGNLAAADIAEVTSAVKHRLAQEHPVPATPDRRLPRGHRPHA